MANDSNDSAKHRNLAIMCLDEENVTKSDNSDISYRTPPEHPPTRLHRSNPFEHSQNLMQQPYTLDKNKAVQKKIQAASRETHALVETKGGLVLTMSTGAYEMLKNSIEQFYENHEMYDAEITAQVDRKRQ